MEYKNFSKRAKNFDYAKKKYKKILKNENMCAVTILDVKKGEKILHLFAGGIYIDEYIDVECELIKTDVIQELCDLSQIQKISMEKIPYDNNSFDKVLIMTSLHHFNENERKIIYDEVKRVLKIGGFFILSDVIKKSHQEKFLNVFVNNNNPCGHLGLFFDEVDKNLLLDSGFLDVQCKIYKYTWDFESIDELNDFCYNLFYLQNMDKDNIYEEVKKYLEVYKKDDKIYWKWELIFFICQK
jgi:SAM-dependent methyltransferase